MNNLIVGATPVTLSPSGPVLVCSGQQLELMCTTAGGFLEWNFYISENMTTITSGRLVSNQPGPIDPYMTDSIIFNISRVSLPGNLPLVSKLLITTERSSINGTEVRCTCRDAVTGAEASTTIFITREKSVLLGMLVCLLDWLIIIHYRY